MNAAIYARVACTDQLSLDCQVESIQRYASLCGYNIVEVIAENGVSAFGNGKGIAALMRLAKEGQISTVLCCNPSRIGRSLNRLFDIQTALRRLGVSIQYLPPYEQDNGAFEELFMALHKCI